MDLRTLPEAERGGRSFPAAHTMQKPWLQAARLESGAGDDWLAAGIHPVRLEMQVYQAFSAVHVAGRGRSSKQR